ncbi:MULTISPECIES: SGNH/GDSL hydrolase family protein [Photobacterium]
MTRMIMIASLMAVTPAFADNIPVTPEMMSVSYIANVQNRQTYTYVKCWYRPAQNHDDPATAWEWARDEKGGYFTIDGYWWSAGRLKNMFYTNISQSEIKHRCKETLGVNHDTADFLFYASDNRYSYNHDIWTNDDVNKHVINRIIAFGDSLSDTGNIYNASQWVFPNRNSWFLGHFSNGYVWTEYLANGKDISLYNWAVGGAAGTNQYLLLTGIYAQVTSYLTYMKMAKNYYPENSLITLEFGLNDFINYGREVADVKADLSSALIRLTESGVKNILLFTLPDATKAPQFKYASPNEINTVRAKILAFNAFITEQSRIYKEKGLNVVLFDAYNTFEKLIAQPQLYGFENANDACLNISRSSAKDYFYRHNLTNDCAYHGSDKYVFWGVTHPTTAIHKYIANQILETKLESFNFSND